MLIDDLTSPFGMALVGDDLYVADTDRLLAFPYRPGATRIDAAGRPVATLPAGEINHHWTKGLAARPDGGELFVSVGSNSDHGENGMDAERGRAAIWASIPPTAARRCSPRACAIRSASTSSRGPARCGPSSTSATSSAATSCPTI